MNQTAETIKRLVSMEELAEHYGFYPNRGGYISCPFHKEKTASLKIYTDRDGHNGWHCFGCGRGGSVIDFVMALFGIDYRQAVLRINQDFSLGLTNKRASRAQLSEAAKKARQERRDAERREQEWWEAIRLLWYYRDAVELAQPVRTEDSIWIHPIYAEAVKALPEIEYWLDERFQEGDDSRWNKFQSSARTTS